MDNISDCKDTTLFPNSQTFIIIFLKLFLAYCIVTIEAIETIETIEAIETIETIEAIETI